MVKYKETERDQGIMIPIYLGGQLVSGALEYVYQWLFCIFDMSAFLEWNNYRGSCKTSVL